MANSTCQCPAADTEDKSSKLAKAFEKLMCCESDSMLKKYLTKEVYEKLKCETTSNGGTLLDCINSGIENLDATVGVFAADPESYTVFRDLMNPIINDCHGGFTPCNRHPEGDWGDLMAITDLDPKNENVVSIRLCCARSLMEYPFHPLLKKEQYCEIEKKICDATSSLPGELGGKYYSLSSLSECEIKKLTGDGYLFSKGDKQLEAANANQFWPTGRGIFYNDIKSFIIWVNSEDHIRVISMQCGGNLGAAYSRLVDGMKEIEARVKCVYDERLGYITFNPKKVGTALKASMCVKLPKSAQNINVEELENKYKIKICTLDKCAGLFEVSTQKCLGFTEFEIIKELHDAVAQFLKTERGL